MGEVHAISFFLSPRDKHDICKAEVPLFTAIEYLDEVNLQILSSNFLFNSP